MTSEIDIRNLPVDAFTTPGPVTTSSTTAVSKAMLLMESHGIRHLPVLDEKNAPVGIITDRDIRSVKAFANLAEINVAEIMTETPKTIIKGSALIDAVYTMSNEKIGSLVVCENNGEVYGIFTVTDALNALIEVVRGDILETE